MQNAAEAMVHSYLHKVCTGDSASVASSATYEIELQNDHHDTLSDEVLLKNATLSQGGQQWRLKAEVRRTSQLKISGWDVYIHRLDKKLVSHFTEIFRPVTRSSIQELLKWQAGEDKECTERLNASFCSATCWLNGEYHAFTSWNEKGVWLQKLHEWNFVACALCWPALISTVLTLQLLAYMLFAVLHACLSMCHGLLLLFFRLLIALLFPSILLFLFCTAFLGVLGLLMVTAVCVVCHFCPIFWWLCHEYDAVSIKLISLGREKVTIKCTASLLHNKWSFLNKSRSVKKTLASQEELTIDGLASTRSFMKNRSPYCRDKNVSIRCHIQLLDPVESDPRNSETSIVECNTITGQSSAQDFYT